LRLVWTIHEAVSLIGYGAILAHEAADPMAEEGIQLRRALPQGADFRQVLPITG